MTARRVVVCEPVHPDALAHLRGAGWKVVETSGDLPPAEALIVRVRRLTAEEAGRFALISKHGVGVDNIPLAAVRGMVANTPGANAGAVAEQALMLLLALMRDLDGQRAGRVAGVAGLEGRRLSVLGFGASGARLARGAAALGAAVTVFARPAREAAVRAAGFGYASGLRAALAGAGAVSLHLPLTPQTRGMIGAAELAALPAGAVIVNCARGGIVDEAALMAALSSGHLGGAALDATEVEPLPADHPLRACPRLILTPHAAGLSRGAFRAMGMQAAQNVIDWAEGRLRPEVVVVAPGAPSRLDL